MAGMEGGGDAATTGGELVANDGVWMAAGAFVVGATAGVWAASGIRARLPNKIRDK